MPIVFTNKTDVFKFALSLYDYLSQNGHPQQADNLSKFVDSCFPSDALALKIHLKAFIEIKQNIMDLSPYYKKSLQNAIDYIHSLEPKEIELKLRLHDSKIGEKILQDPLVVKLSQNAQPRVKDYETTYYDTQAHHFLKQQVCYRIRNFSGEYTATIKGSGSSQDGLSVRSEWNRKLTENIPSLEPFSDLSIGQVLKEAIQEEEILPILITRFKRIALDLLCEDGSLIELAIDLGEIEAGDKREAISEIELELKNGQVEEIHRLGKMFTEVYHLQPEDKSKYQRGLMLAGLNQN